MEKLDEGLKTLLDLGKRRGFLTFDQVNDYLPDEASSPEKIHGLLESLDELGIELINEDEAESRLLASGDIDDEPDELVDEPVDDDDGELTPEDLDEISRRIDDPVRMYLTQMGEIPLLTRDQEISLAKKIEITRKRFRRKVLECHFALALVVDVLKKVNDGELPFDRTVKVSVTENLEKDQILGRMPHNLATLAHLMDCNNRDFRAYVRERDKATRRQLLADLKSRRRKAVNLVEELSIRTQKVQPLMKRLEQVAARMAELMIQLQDHRAGRGGKEDRANLQKELKDLMRITLETPDEPAQPGRGDERPVPRVRAGQARALRGQPPAGRLDRQEVPQPRPLVPRPDPGREHRPDAGRRQVRVSPRLQVQHLRHLVDPPGDHPRHRRPGPDDPHPGPHDRDDVEAPQRLEEAAPGEGPRADHRGDRQGRQHLDRGDPAGDEDQPPPDLARPARSARARTATSATSSRTRPPRARSTPPPRRCSRRRSTRSSRP